MAGFDLEAESCGISFHLGGTYIYFLGQWLLPFVTCVLPVNPSRSLLSLVRKKKKAKCQCALPSPKPNHVMEVGGELVSRATGVSFFASGPFPTCYQMSWSRGSQASKGSGLGAATGAANVTKPNPARSQPHTATPKLFSLI